MYRASHSTIQNVELQFKKLRENAMLLSMWNLGRSRFSPLGWDSPAFVENLRAMLSNESVPCQAVNQLQVAVQKWLRNPKLGLQKMVGKILRAHLPVDWPYLLDRRLKVLCKEYKGDIVSACANLEPRLKLLPSSTRFDHY